MSFKHISLWFLIACVCVRGFAQGVVVAPDNSQDSMELISQGMPSYDRAWTSDDLQVAAQMIADIASKDPTLLPRENSATSGLLFSRMVAFENLDVMDQFRGTASEVTHIVGYLNPSIQIFQTYASATSGANSYDSEVVEYCTYLLEITNRLFPLAAKLKGVVSTDNQDQNGNTDQDKMMQGLSEMVGGLLTLLADKQDIRTKELTKLAMALQKYFGPMSNYILPGTKKEAVVRLQSMVKGESDISYKKSLNDLLAVVQR